MSRYWDVIVVGARCAGSSTAMLLARRGYSVLVVDRASFPSDTVSSHLVHPPGVAALDRWALFDRVAASGCPPILQYSFDFGPFTLTGTPRPHGETSTAYAPRRTVLDKILVDAAAEAGAEVRERFTVEEVLTEAGTVVGIQGRDAKGRVVVERGRVVVGADGRYSKVAKAVRPREYRTQPALNWALYSYWKDLPVDGVEIYIRPYRGWGAFPTNDDLTVVIVGWPIAEADAYKADAEANYLQTLDLAPDFAARARRATRVGRFAGGPVTNYFRQPYGRGWALVGDAGYNKDSITAQGISDAFRDAELCTAALDQSLRGERPFDDAMAAYQQARDTDVDAIHDFTTQLATLAPPPPEVQQLLAACAGNTHAMDDFVSVVAGTLSPAEFFDPHHIEQLLGTAQERDRRTIEPTTTLRSTTTAVPQPG